jgi:putative Mg2+ transporter-C (MgtC) family protein
LNVSFPPTLDWASLPEAAVKLALAAVLGGLLGLEREAHGQAAGFRTYILIAVGSCLMMMVSLNIEAMYRLVGAESAVRIDPGRIASYALAGMGFLGAGAIIKGAGTVRGVTTAAGMWLTTGVGLAIGSDYYIPGVLATLMSFIILYFLRYTKPFFSRDEYTTLTLVSDDIDDQLQRIEEVVAKYRFSDIQFVGLHRQLDKGTITFRIIVLSKEDTDWRPMTRELAALPGIHAFSRVEAKVP